MRPEKSGNQEFFFVTDPARQLLARPLFFHHIPKTGGTSIRAAARAWMWENDAGEIIAPHFERELRSAGAWPKGVIRFFEATKAVARVEAVMGHYTSVLAPAISDPIIALVRDPTEQLASNLTFRPNRLALLGDGIFDDPRIANAQMHSLTQLAIPRDAPEGTDLTHWEEVVEETIERFALFAYEDRRQLFHHLETDYGMALAEGSRLKPRPADPHVDEIVAGLMAKARQRDPVWLDRILYNRVSRTDG